MCPLLCPTKLRTARFPCGFATGCCTTTVCGYCGAGVDFSASFHKCSLSAFRRSISRLSSETDVRTSPNVTGRPRLAIASLTAEVLRNDHAVHHAGRFYLVFHMHSLSAACLWRSNGCVETYLLDDSTYSIPDDFDSRVWRK